MDDKDGSNFSSIVDNKLFWKTYLWRRFAIFLGISIPEIIAFIILFPEFSLFEKPDSFTAQILVWAIFIALYPFAEAFIVFTKSIFDHNGFEDFKKQFLREVKRREEDKIRSKEISSDEENRGCGILLLCVIAIMIILYTVFTFWNTPVAIFCGSIFIGVCVLVSRR